MRTLGALLAVVRAAAIAQPALEVRHDVFAPVKPVPSVLRLVDWNIDRGTRLDRVLETLRKPAPDLCVLQEVDRGARRTGGRDVAGDLARALGMNYVYGDAFQELGQGIGRRPAFQGQAVLTNLPVRAARVLRFERQTRFWRPHPLVPSWRILQRRAGGRIALVVELGRERADMVVYDVHLESRGFGVTRMAQLRELLADARQYPADTPVVVAGDLNSKYRPGRFESALAGESFHNCAERRVRTHVVMGALDWVFLRGPAACAGVRVIRGSHASDHDPIVTEIRLGVSR